MKSRDDGLEAVDRWLRQGLEPEEDTALRVVGRVLEDPPAAAGLLPARRLALSLAVSLAAVLAAAVAWWPQGVAPPPAESVRIANHGELVTLVAAGGEVWLHAPPRPVPEAAPRLIITIGGPDAE